MLANYFAGCLIAVVAIPDVADSRQIVAIPDVVMPGVRFVRTETAIECQPMIDYCCVQHIVVKGETLAKIAVGHGNGKTTIQDILALNPGLVPTKLAVGQRLWMPPRIAVANKPMNTFVFMDWRRRSVGFGKPFAPKDKVVERSGVEHCTFTLVPANQLAAYTKCVKDNDYSGLSKIQKSGKVKLLQSKGSVRAVWGANPVRSCKETIQIKRSKDGVFSSKVTSIYLDEAGKVVPLSEVEKDYRLKHQSLPMLLLPLVGGVWLLCSRRKRRQSNAFQTA